MNKKHYFTFGYRDEDPDTGENLAKKYCLIEAPSSSEARAYMFVFFGNKWAFQYSEEEEKSVLKHCPRGMHFHFDSTKELNVVVVSGGVVEQVYTPKEKMTIIYDFDNAPGKARSFIIGDLPHDTYLEKISSIGLEYANNYNREKDA